MYISIIVEGINDKRKIKGLLQPNIKIFCTYGTPSTSMLEDLVLKVGDDDVYIFTDNDVSGKNIRGKLREYFPDAFHIYTRREYGAVEKTPLEYIQLQLVKAGLEEYILPIPTNPASWTKDQF